MTTETQQIIQRFENALAELWRSQSRETGGDRSIQVKADKVYEARMRYDLPLRWRH